MTTPNIGNADLFLGDPNDHVAANDGLYEFATCHQHYHFKHYATYELVDPNSGFVWKAAKRGFCMLDTDPNPANLGEPAKTWQFRSCGGIGIPGNQGISHGWSDTYVFKLGGQYFLLDGGDGQPPVPPGTYMLRITVNPPYAPDNHGNWPACERPRHGTLPSVRRVELRKQRHHGVDQHSRSSGPNRSWTTEEQPVRRH